MVLHFCSVSRIIPWAPALLAAPVLANPVGTQPQALQPYSRTAREITGPIILSDTRIVFGNGETLGLTLIDSANEGTWDITGGAAIVQLFEASGEIGPVLNGNTVCSAGPPRFLTAYATETFGSWNLTLTFFEGDAPPTSISSSGLCGTYSYEFEPLIDLGASSPETLGESVPNPERNSGNWVVRSESNPVDDTRTVIARLSSDSGRSRWGEPIELYARCQSNTTEVYVVWHDYLGDDSYDVYDEFKHVTVRIGDAPAREERWGVSTSGDAAFAPGWAGDLLKEMLQSDRLVLQTTPHGESPITAVFDTSGLDIALRDLAETCNWSY